MIDYLSQIWNSYKQFKEDYIDFDAYMLKEPRSDILKELTYSRQATDDCSYTTKAYQAETRVLDCTTAKHQLISPIVGNKITKDYLSVLTHSNQINLGSLTTLDNYCYGKNLGQVVVPSKDLDLTDNWFCCDKFIRDK